MLVALFASCSAAFAGYGYTHTYQPRYQQPVTTVTVTETSTPCVSSTVSTRPVFEIRKKSTGEKIAEGIAVTALACCYVAAMVFMITHPELFPRYVERTVYMPVTVVERVW